VSHRVDKWDTFSEKPNDIKAGFAAVRSAEEWSHAATMLVLCFAFGAGALAGAWLAPRLGGATLVPVAALIAGVIAAGPRGLEIPDWSDLK
jgi:hypothetical protein